MGRPWFYEDVTFDAARAHDAVEALRRLHRQINELGDLRARQARESLGEWRGRFRDEFDAAFPAAQRQLAAMEHRIEAAIREIGAGEQRAVDERRRRATLRESYEEELRRAAEREAAARSTP